MFHSKFFATYEAEAIASWLNGLRKNGHYVKVEVMSSNAGLGVVVVAGVFVSRSLNEVPERTTIDEIPEEPTIQYPDGDLPSHDQT